MVLAAVPVGRLDGVDVAPVQGVNLLKRLVLGLHDEEEDDDDERGAAACKDEAVKVVDFISDKSGAANL